MKSLDEFEKELNKKLLALLMETFEKMEEELVGDADIHSVITASLIGTMGVITADAVDEVPLSYFVGVAHEMKKACDHMQSVQMPDVH